MKNYFFVFQLGFFCLPLWGVAEEVEKASTASITLPELKWSGYVQTRYLVDKATGVADSFGLNEAKVGIQAEITKQWLAVLKISAKGLSNGIGLRQAYLDYKPWSFLFFRMGQFSLPSTRENLLPTSDLDFVNRSRTVLAIFPSPDNLDMGFMGGGRYEAPEAKWLPSLWELQAGLVNGVGANKKDDTEQKTSVGKLFVHWGDVGLGGAWYAGDRLDPISNKPVIQNRFGGEVELGSPGQSIHAEWWQGQDATVRSQGWFISGDVPIPLINPRAYEVIEWLRRFRMGIRFETWNPNIDVRGDRQMITSVALHFFPASNVKLTLNFDDIQEETKELRVPNDQLVVQAQIKF